MGMKPDAKIVIVYSSFGDGHHKVALALQHTFNSMGYFNVRMIDLLEEAHPWMNAISKSFYLKSSIYAPRLYGLIYHLTNNRKPNRLATRFYHSVGKKTVKQAWAEEQPDLIVHTFPLLTADELRYKTQHDIPTITVITDYVLHSRWVHENTSLYCVGSESLKQQLTKSGIPDSRIVVTGIPLRESFLPSRNREQLCHKYGLDANRSRVLIMAGAYGVQASVREMIDTVLASTGSEMIVVCGRNVKLKNALDATFAAEARVHVTGYVDDIPDRMAISDCLLTKAGGITLTEAIAMSLPTIVYRPLPGQERGNADYLFEQGAIGVAYRKKELAQQLQLALSESGSARMREQMSRLYQEDSAAHIVMETLKQEGTSGIFNPAYSLNERKAVRIHV